MKKLLITTYAVAFFGVAAFAQQQDTTENNQYRSIRKNTTQAIDTTATDIEEGVEETRDDIQRGARRTRDDVRQGAERTGDRIQQGSENARDEAEESAEEAGEEIRQSVDTTSSNFQEGAAQAGETFRQESEKAINSVQGDEADDASTQANSNKTATASMEAGTDMANAQVESEVEVVEDKEGPNNEVVYEYQGEMYYVDRTKNELVKAEESQLKDSPHKVTVKDNTTTTADKSGKKKGRS